MLLEGEDAIIDFYKPIDINPQDFNNKIKRVKINIHFC